MRLEARAHLARVSRRARPSKAALSPSIGVAGLRALPPRIYFFNTAIINNAPRLDLAGEAGRYAHDNPAIAAAKLMTCVAKRGGRKMVCQASDQAKLLRIGALLRNCVKNVDARLSSKSVGDV